METDRYLNEFYNRINEDERLQSRHGQLEFISTTHYIDKYLEEGMRILEVGAGTGRYSIHYAKQGYNVDSVELIQKNIDIFKDKITDTIPITLRQGNAMDLSMYDDDSFDITLVLGPLYHLFTKEDKNKAIAEAIRVTKPNGKLFFAYIPHDAVIIHWGLVGGNFKRGVETGILTEQFECNSSPEQVFEMFYVHEFDEMMKSYNVGHLHTVATDGLAEQFSDKINDFDDKTYKQWIKYHLTVCERRELLGYSNHILYVCTKEDKSLR